MHAHELQRILIKALNGISSLIGRLTKPGALCSFMAAIIVHIFVRFFGMAIANSNHKDRMYKYSGSFVN